MSLIHHYLHLFILSNTSYNTLIFLMSFCLHSRLLHLKFLGASREVSGLIRNWQTNSAGA